MKTIGILGAGQLARMIALAGIPMGFRFKFYDPNPNSPVQNLGELNCAQFSDIDYAKKFAESVDIITYEFENVPVTLVQELEKIKQVFPGSNALEQSQDRLTEKSFFQSLGISTAPFIEITSHETLETTINIWGQGILKTRRMGYDGKGQFVLRNKEEANHAWNEIKDVPCILEGFVDFHRELSIIASRSTMGEIAFYPLVQNIHKDGILSKTIAPAVHVDTKTNDQAKNIAIQTLEALNYVGTLAIELFDTDKGLVVNEMAPRVHNSGHWTIEGARTSQFENHVRAIAGLPLGNTDLVGNSVMLNCIGSMPTKSDILKISHTHFHSYDKEARAGRKVGHITISDLENDSNHESHIIDLENIINKSTY